MISAVEALRAAGCVVKDAVVLVDRLEGGKANLASLGVRLSAFADVKELVGILREKKKVTKADHEAVLEQMEGRRK